MSFAMGGKDQEEGLTTFPQVPQLMLSLSRLAHVPPQDVNPAPHAGGTYVALAVAYSVSVGVAIVSVVLVIPRQEQALL